MQVVVPSPSEVKKRDNMDEGRKLLTTEMPVVHTPLGNTGRGLPLAEH